MNPSWVGLRIISVGVTKAFVSWKIMPCVYTTLHISYCGVVLHLKQELRKYQPRQHMKKKRHYFALEIFHLSVSDSWECCLVIPPLSLSFSPSPPSFHCAAQEKSHDLPTRTKGQTSKHLPKPAEREWSVSYSTCDGFKSGWGSPWGV